MKLHNISLLLASILVLFLIGCTTTDIDLSGTKAKLPIQYATLKLIETSDSISAQDVIDRVQNVREFVGEDQVIDVSDLVNEVIQHVDWGSLDAADKLLVQTVIDVAAEQLSDAGVLVNDAGQPITTLVQLMTVLDWVEQAAVMAL